MFFLFLEHIISYFSNIYREYEIEHYGQPDVNGVYRAKKESLMRTIEVLFDCILVGWIIKHLLMLDSKEFHEYSYYSYWMVIDAIMMLTT